MDKAPVSPKHARALATERAGGIKLVSFETDDDDAEEARVHLALQFNNEYHYAVPVS